MRNDMDEPSLIMLGRRATRTERPEPEAAQTRALIRAGFRSTAARALTERLDGSHGDGAPGRDAVARALDTARAAFGPVDADTEAETRAALDGLVAEGRGRAEARADEQRRERALDALEAEADDLLAALRRDPDRAPDYAVLLARATDRFAPGLDGETLGAWRTNLGREAAGARVLGLIDRERFGEARATVEAEGTPVSGDDRRRLRRVLAVAERAAGDRALADRLAATTMAERAILAGEAVSAEAVRSPADRRRLAQLEHEVAGREAANAARMTAAAEAASGGGWPGAWPHEERALAAELYWERVAAATVAGLDAARQPEAVAALVSRLGEVPVALRRRLQVGLGAGVDPGLRLEAARWLHEIVREAPWAVPAFGDGERRFAHRVTQALDSGLYRGREAEALAWADRQGPVERRTVGLADEDAVRRAARDGSGPFAAVRRSLDGGPPLDVGNLDDQLLAAVAWRETLSGDWRRAGPEAAAEMAADFVQRTRVMPASLMGELRRSLAGEDAAAAARAALTVAAIVDVLPEHVGLLESFELARASLIQQAVTAGRGAEEAVRFAIERHPAPQRGAPGEEAPERADDGAQAAMGVDAVASMWTAALL